MVNRIIKPKSAIIEDIIFLVVGLILLILSSFVLIKGLIQDSKYLDTKATVKTIIENDDERYIIVSYSVEGLDLEAKYPFFDARLDLDDVVDIKYNPSNPSEITARRGGYLFTSIVGIFIAAFMMIYKGLILYSFLKEKKRVAYLTTKGIKVDAKIVAVEENNKNMIHRHIPSIITCTYEMGDNSFVLTSKDIFIDANISGYVGKNVAVYTEDLDFNNYYIDYTEVK